MIDFAVETCVNFCIPSLASAQVSNIFFENGKEPDKPCENSVDIFGPSPSGEFHLWHLINEYIQYIQTERQKKKPRSSGSTLMKLDVILNSYSQNR